MTRPGSVAPTSLNEGNSEDEAASPLVLPGSPAPRLAGALLALVFLFGLPLCLFLIFSVLSHFLFLSLSFFLNVFLLFLSIFPPLCLCEPESRFLSLENLA